MGLNELGSKSAHDEKEQRKRSAILEGKGSRDTANRPHDITRFEPKAPGDATKRSTSPVRSRATTPKSPVLRAFASNSSSTLIRQKVSAASLNIREAKSKAAAATHTDTDGHTDPAPGSIQNTKVNRLATIEPSTVVVSDSAADSDSSDEDQRTRDRTLTSKAEATRMVRRGETPGGSAAAKEAANAEKLLPRHRPLSPRDESGRMKQIEKDYYEIAMKNNDLKAEVADLKFTIHTIRHQIDAEKQLTEDRMRETVKKLVAQAMKVKVDKQAAADRERLLGIKEKGLAILLGHLALLRLRKKFMRWRYVTMMG